MERRQFLRQVGLGAAAAAVAATPSIAAATSRSHNEKETIMYDQSKPYAPLTADNAALILVDHQVGLMTGVRDYETGELKHNVVALAKAAKVLRIPTVVTTAVIRSSLRDYADVPETDVHFASLDRAFQAFKQAFVASRQSKVDGRAAAQSREALRSSSRQRLALMAWRLCRSHRRR
jgi:hypothetical protein